jgi:hypothetical protein
VLLWGCSLCGGEDAVDAGGQSADEVAAPEEPRAAEPAEPEGLEKLGSLWLVDAEIKGFDQLDLAAKLIALHHSRAAAAGDGILYGQVGEGLPRARRLLAGIMRNDKRIPASIRAKIAPFATRFFAFHGNVDPRTGDRLKARFIPGELAAAAQVAVEDGADIGLGDVPGTDLGASRLQELEVLMALVRPWIFQPGAPPSGDDAGAGEGSPAAWSGEIKRVITHLEGALKMQRSAERERARQVIESLSPDGAGRVVDLSEEAPTSGIATIIGFVAGADDERGADPAFGALVSVIDAEADEQLRALAAAAPAIDKRIAEEIGAQKTAGRIEPTRVRAVQAVAASGLFGPVLPERGTGPAVVVGPILHVSEETGYLLLTNLAAAADQVVGESIVRAFSADEQIANRRIEHRGRARLAMLALRETVGRGTDGTERRPRDFLRNRLGEHVEVMAELRADLTAIYAAFDGQLAQIGLVSDAEQAKAIVDEYLSAALERLAFVTPGSRLTDPRHQALQIAVGNLIEKGLVTVERGKGRLALRVPDYAALRSGVGELLATVRRIRNGGSKERAAELVEKHGGTPPSGWVETARRSWRDAGLPLTLGFVYPTLEPVVGVRGATSGVELMRADSFLEMQINAAMAPR